MNTECTVDFIHGWSGEQVQALQAQTAQALGLSPVFQDTLQDGSLGPALAVIPAGEFVMGTPENEVQRCRDEIPHRIQISRPFALGQYAVTFAEYDRFAEATGREKPDDLGWGRDKRPVIGVNWHDAVAYTQWLSEQTGQVYQLPTEAEWEYACRAGAASAFWWGNDINPEQANYNGHCRYGIDGQIGIYREQTVAVDEFAANPWGLHQMHGNIWEWCRDVYLFNIEKDTVQIDPEHTKGGPYRVLRGGSWSYSPNCLRAAHRDFAEPAYRYCIYGFRLARKLAT